MGRNTLLLCGELVVASFLLFTGCLSSRQHSVSSDRIRIVPFGECLHASNGVVDLVVSPQTGRLIGYGWSGERNLLWLNSDADAGADGAGGWLDWGGVRNWVWPKDDWRRLIGREWPPPVASDGLPYRLTVKRDGRSLQLQSDVLPDYGFAILSTIVFSENGSSIAVATRFKRQGARPASTPWVAPWTLTQVPFSNDGLFARLAFDEPGETLYPFDGRAEAFPELRRYGRVIAFDRLSENPWEAGLEADLFALRLGNTLLVQKTLPFAKSALFRPGERAQIRVATGDSTASESLEMAFTGPLVSGSSVGKSELVVLFSLVRLPTTADEATVAAMLRDF